MPGIIVFAVRALVWRKLLTDSKTKTILLSVQNIGKKTGLASRSQVISY